jgi:hypothetical protein
VHNDIFLTKEARCYSKKLTPTLSAQEKTVLIGFAAVFFIYLLGMLNSDDIYSSFKKTKSAELKINSLHGWWLVVIPK